ncbi:MAG: O-antigen ligase family protein [Micromonosporaceae bacterium]
MTSPLVVRPSNGHRTTLGASATRHQVADGAALLIVVIALAYLLPERLIFTDLASVGRPAMLAGMALAGWWFLTRLHPALVTGGRQPVRWALGTYLVSLLFGYAAGQIRGLSVLEQNGADRAILAALAFAGVALIAADGITDRRRLDLVLRTTVWAGAAMAVLGIGQFVLQRDFTEFISVPPVLTFQAPPVGFSPRGAGGMFRVAGTAGHYIEFSVLLAMILPLAIHYTRYAADRRHRQLFGGITALLVLTIPLSLSRTGILALFVVLAAMAPAWSWRARLNAACAALGLAVVLNVIRPGLIGTMRALLLNTENDPSIIGRTEDYAVVAPLVAERPWFGRGTGTFLPELYLLLDNQWLLTLVSGGLIGVVGLAVVYLTGIGLSLSSYRRAMAQRESASAAAGARAGAGAGPRAGAGEASRDMHLAAALGAGLLVAMLSGFTFDALYFSTYALTVALFLGAAGALWRLLGDAHPDGVADAD